MQSVFVSYSHRQGNWVWGRLVPILKLAGAEVLIDIERFKSGIGLGQQMDALQDRADRQLLCFSTAYLTSKFCDREWRRAVDADPDCSSGRVIPLVLENHVDLPRKLRNKNPLYVNLAPDSDPKPWQLLLNSLGLSIDCCPAAWLQVVQDVYEAMREMKSVNLVFDSGLLVTPIVEHLVECDVPMELLKDLKIVDMASGACASRRGLLQSILEKFGIREELPISRPNDIVEFDRLANTLPPMRLALHRFDMAASASRQKQYGDDLFASFFHLTQQRRLSLLVISHRPYAALLPATHPISSIPFMNVELRKT